MGKIKNVVRGTPVNHVGPAGAFIGGREGFSPGKPAGLVGTVKEQFDSDRRGYQSDPRGGTPYHSQTGNPNEASRIAEGTGRYGVVLSENGQNMNDPASNGDGVILDGQKNDYADPPVAPTMDSPVPTHASRFDTGDIVRENRAHLGKGSGPTAPNEANARDDLMKVGGVMSR